jgi:chemotaxis protein histidine kinase CheA
MGKAQIIAPLRRLDPGQPLFDADAVSRADQAMKAMSGSFEQWLAADIEKLQTARLEAECEALSDASLDRLMRAAHDLKGMGGSYGYPLVTRLAASLCRLIETEAGKEAARASPGLAAAHVDALRAAVRERIASDADPMGRALLDALEAQVAALGVAPR